MDPWAPLRRSSRSPCSAVWAEDLREYRCISILTTICAKCLLDRGRKTSTSHRYTMLGSYAEPGIMSLTLQDLSCRDGRFYAHAYLGDLHLKFPRFPKKPWEVMKIMDYSLVFDQKPWISMISQDFLENLGNLRYRFSRYA